MGSAKPKHVPVCLKTNSVRFVDNGYEYGAVVEIISEEVGLHNIMGCVKSAGQWIVTMKNSDDAQLLQEIGIKVGNDICLVSGVLKSIVTVSLFGVPVYITDDELTQKLVEFGCTLKSKWIRKHYKEYPAVENGIRYVRIELPNNVKSLPYAIIVGGVHLRMKHNGQTRVCNRCLSDTHIMKDCPDYVCRECGRQGHSESRCPRVLCYNCHKHGHKSFLCPGKADDGHMSESENGTDHPDKVENIEVDETGSSDGGEDSKEVNMNPEHPLGERPAANVVWSGRTEAEGINLARSKQSHPQGPATQRDKDANKSNVGMLGSTSNGAAKVDMNATGVEGIQSRPNKPTSSKDEKTNGMKTAVPMVSGLSTPKPKPKPKPKPEPRPLPLPRRQSAEDTGSTKRTVSSDDESAVHKQQRSSSLPKCPNVTPNLSAARSFTPKEKPNSR